MAEGAVTLLLEKLKEVVIGHRVLISGAEKNEFEHLIKDFHLLEAFLKESKKEKDIPYFVLKRRIRQVVYEVEDTIDICLTTNQSSFAIATEVRSIRDDRVRPLIDVVSRFDKVQRTADAAGATEVMQARRRRDIPISQNRIRDLEDEERITSYLKEKTELLNVISIAGDPGSGKTKLAWNIYQSKVIHFHFPIRIWVSVSQSFNIRIVFLQILKEFTNRDMSYLDDDSLSQTVRDYMEIEKFLLVFDDVRRSDWSQIQNVLPLHNGESKVIVTTRSPGIGKIPGSYSYHQLLLRLKGKTDEERGYQLWLKLPTDEESWMLLQLEVFGNLEDCPQVLSETGRAIARECYGQALLIGVIGGILAHQLTGSLPEVLNQWKTVEKNMIRLGRKENLALGYEALPDELRECFLFLGVFPEDYEIPAKMLCGLWILEGLVVARNGDSLEDSAEENMYDLIYRRLLNVEKTNHMGKAKTCRVDSVIRDLCISKSKDDSEVRNSHRLCLISDLSEFLSNETRPDVRSFLCFHDQPVFLKPELISIIPDTFKKLRILESKSIMFDQFPTDFTKLVHLRYLTLHIQTLKILPESIAQLWNLQYLVVETKSRSTTMEANMWRMAQLRCLKTRAAIFLDNDWEGEAGNSLHTLSRLAPESCTEAVSRRAKNLKTLGIFGKLASVFQTHFLENLHVLEKLKLKGRISDGLPHGNCFPPNLKRLTLTNTCLGWKHMPTLAMIKSLEVLKLKDNAFVGALWKVDGYNFPNLQFVLVENINFFQWEASTGIMESLRIVVVNNCENLREIPECLGKSLDRLEIYRVRHSLVNSAVNIAEINDRKPFRLTIGAEWKTQVKHKSNISFS